MANQILIAKIFISGKIETETGLHIGGSSTALDIGGIDLNIIKNAKGIPFIPGSSLKGKIRSLLEIEKNTGEDKYFTKDGVHVCNDNECEICNIFGRTSGKKYYYTTDKNGNYQMRQNDKGEPERKDDSFDVDEETVMRTRLIVRDANLDVEKFNIKFHDLELPYSESKTENTINRLNSKAQHPRQQERVPAGALFNYEFVLNILRKEDVNYVETLIHGMRLLEDDYLGGSGSRGYGKIRFNGVKLEIKTPSDYSGNNLRAEIVSTDNTSLNISETTEKIQEIINSKGV